MSTKTIAFEKETLRNLALPGPMMMAGVGDGAPPPLAKVWGTAVSSAILSAVSSAVITAIASAIGSAISTAVASGPGSASAGAAASKSAGAIAGASVSMIGSGYLTFKQ